MCTFGNLWISDLFLGILEKIQCSFSLPNIKYNCVVLFLSQLYWLFIYASKYIFPIFQHCTISPIKQNCVLFIHSVYGDIFNLQIWWWKVILKFSFGRKNQFLTESKCRIFVIQNKMVTCLWKFTQPVFAAYFAKKNSMRSIGFVSLLIRNGIYEN